MFSTHMRIALELRFAPATLSDAPYACEGCALDRLGVKPEAELPWPSLWAGKPALVLDGAMGTELERTGVIRPGNALWSARALRDHPSVVEAIHFQYAQAGADILTTASYQASVPGFIQAGLSRREAIHCLKRSVTLAENAIDRFRRAGGMRDMYIAASIGPYGAYLADRSEYTGHYGVSRDVLHAFHTERIEILADSPAHMLACESIPCQMEAEVLIEILAAMPETKAWISFTCKDGRRVSHGEPLRDCVALCAALPNVIAGVNCIPPYRVEPLLVSAARKQAGLRVAYANEEKRQRAGVGREQQDTSSRVANSVALARDWIARGVRIVGGCCGATPALIRALAATIRNDASLREPE